MPEDEEFEAYKGESLPVAYEQVKGMAEAQMSHGGDIDAKAAAMFALATALAGVALPLILVRLGTGHPIPFIKVPVGLALVSAVAYVGAFVLFVKLYSLQKYQDLRNPEQIKRIIGLSEQDAYISLYRGIENIYTNNREINEKKIRLFKWLFRFVGFQTLLVIVVSLLVALASLGPI